ncbi:MAG: hypothetical protein GY694_15225 [Gammaproteobacteria bacterium]|nr:hypothetical protein [Gammaproteobacteria bacterium]
MLIDGPLQLQIIENEGFRELNVTFKEEFQLLDLQKRVEQMKQHLSELQTHYRASNDAAEQQGMQMIIQVVSQILPLIEADEVACDETIVLDLGKVSPINDLIKEAKL